MRHEEATRLMAAERYLLGELSGAERDQFEEHFFDCPACAEDVRAGAIFEANARAIFADQPREDPVRSWWEWVCLRPAVAGAAASVVVLLSGGVGYQAVLTNKLRTEVAELRAPEAYRWSSLRSTTRGAEQPIEVPKENKFLGLSLDLTPGQSFRQYLGEVSGESGGILFTVAFSKPRTPGEPLNLLIPVSSLEPGRRYTLVVRGLDEGSTRKPAAEVSRYYFITQRD